MDTKNLRPNRLITVGNTVSVAGPTLTPSSGLRVDWPADGVVLWCAGSVQGITTQDNFWSGMSSLGFRIQRKGVSEFVSNGSAADYAQFSTVFPTAGFRLPMNVPIKASEPWFVFFRNVHATAAFTPNFVFAVAEGKF